ncbi:hypothetical protein [Herbidospora cretacea]|uniref:hypothetical protein n=1 Tax=Herbidospora cretacea TaxID=28444 RepID=UPI0012FC7069|nr:hypothetical protein [Herbidospora cretacea]
MASAVKRSSSQRVRHSATKFTTGKKRIQSGIKFLFVAVGTFLAGIGTIAAVIIANQQANLARSQLADERRARTEERKTESEREAEAFARRISVMEIETDEALTPYKIPGLSWSYHQLVIGKKLVVRNSNGIPALFSANYGWEIGQEGAPDYSISLTYDILIGACQEWEIPLLLHLTRKQLDRVTSLGASFEWFVSNDSDAWKIDSWNSRPYRMPKNPPELAMPRDGIALDRPSKVRHLTSCADPG